MDGDLKAALDAHKGRETTEEADAETAEETTETEEEIEPGTTEEESDDAPGDASKEDVPEDDAPGDAEDAPKEPPASKAISEWAALELKNRRERQALEAERQQLAAERARAKEAADLIDLLKTNPREFLAKANMPIDDLTKSVLEDRKVDPNQKRIDALEAELRAMREDREKQAEQAEKARIEEARTTHLTRIRAWVEPMKDTYPNLLDVADGDPSVVADAIVQMQEAHYARTKEYLDPAKVADKLEATWKARIERAATRLRGLGQDAAPPEENSGAPTTIGRRHASRTTASKRDKEVTGRDRALARLRGLK